MDQPELHHKFDNSHTIQIGNYRGTVSRDHTQMKVAYTILITKADGSPLTEQEYSVIRPNGNDHSPYLFHGLVDRALKRAEELILKIIKATQSS